MHDSGIRHRFSHRLIYQGTISILMRPLPLDSFFLFRPVSYIWALAAPDSFEKKVQGAFLAGPLTEALSLSSL